MTNGAIGDDNLGIAESGNGIPDLIDEARNEVDFCLNLRDGQGYGYGLTNPNSSNVFYQAGVNALAAWASAANSAMLAEAFRIAGKTAFRGPKLYSIPLRMASSSQMMSTESRS